MSGNNRTFEVDKILIRSLCLKNPDNTTPSPNLAVLTDGTGGTYLRSVYNAANPAGYNAVYLTDSNVSTVANLAYNTLKLKEGPGVALLKDRDDNIVIKSVSIIPSSFSFISTPTGIVYSERVMGTLSVVPDYGTTMSVIDNILHIGGYPSFGAIYVSTTSSILASPQISSFSLIPDFGINLTVTDSNKITIGTVSKSFSLNKITVNSTDDYNFLNPFNNLNLTSKGNLFLNQKASDSLEIQSDSFTRIKVNDKTIDSALTGSSLEILSGYGISTEVLESTIVISSTKPSFDRINTVSGAISSSTEKTEINLTTGPGIDYDVSGQTLNLKLAKQFAGVIQTETVSTIATDNAVFNLRAGPSIEYTNTLDSALKIDTNDFNEVKAGFQTLISNNSDPVYKKKLRLLGLGPLLVQGDPLTNTVSFLMTGGLTQPSTISYSYSQVLIYSTLANINQDTSNYPEPFILNSAPYTSATLGIQGIAPISVVPRYDFEKSSLFYISLDTSNIFRSTIEVVDASIISINKSTVLSNDNGVLLSVSHINTSKANIDSLTVSSIKSLGGNSLIEFDYINNRVAINKHGQPALATLDISGTIVAKMYASYSDPLLKSFKGEYQISPEQLDSLTPKYFNWLEDDKKDVGFSATEVEKVLPEAVKIGPTGLKMVDYSRLSIITIAGLRDSNKRIKTLESTLSGLQLKMDKL